MSAEALQVSEKQYRFRILGTASQQNVQISPPSTAKNGRVAFSIPANNSTSFYFKGFSFIEYHDLIEKWADEFELRRHVLTQEEVDAMNSDFFTDFLQNKETYS